MEHSGSIVDINRKDCLVVNSDDLRDKPFHAAKDSRQLLEEFESKLLQNKYSGVVHGDEARSSSGGAGVSGDRSSAGNSNTNQPHSTQAIIQASTTTNAVSAIQPLQPKAVQLFWLRAGIRVKVTSRSFGPDVYLRRGTVGVLDTVAQSIDVCMERYCRCVGHCSAVDRCMYGEVL